MIPNNSELLQQLMDNMTDKIFFKDLNSRFILVNKACAEWNGFRNPQEAVGKCDFDMFTEEFATMATQDEKRIHETGEPMRCKEEKAEWNDGLIKWVSTTKIPLRDKEGHIVGCIGIGHDITELKTKEAELEETSERLRKVNEQLTQTQEQIAEDLRMAARLQNTFLPQSYPSFISNTGKACLDFHYHYEPDSEIGGDYCSVQQVDETKAGLLICDAMGHGVRAALITGIIRAVSEKLTHQAATAGEFLTAMNQQLYPLLQTGDAFLFTTACYVIIDTQTGMLSGAIAGHPAPFLIQPGQGRASLLKIEEPDAGPALAIVPEYEYATFETQLHPGDEILLYTDGISEAENEAGEEFGTFRLQETLEKNTRLSLQDLLPLLIATAREHTCTTRLGDDICLLGFTLHALRE
ncbi:SpoIIE family protein phosphatase [Pontiellaceae bacterium B12219]|nr:SpoIIE family protein phosphatase [Pontiellaceae bacterium B12219]